MCLVPAKMAGAAEADPNRSLQYENRAGNTAKGYIVKKDIHPELHLVTVHCACGNTFETHCTDPNLRLEICSECHPFYTGKQKLVDSAGRVERFQRRYGKSG